MKADLERTLSKFITQLRMLDIIKDNESIKLIVPKGVYQKVKIGMIEDLKAHCNCGVNHLDLIKDDESIVTHRFGVTLYIAPQ